MGRASKSTKISARQLLAISYLTQGMAPKDIAERMGMDKGTIYSWQKNPLFQERLSQHIESIAKQELDRGLEDATVDMNANLSAIVQWMGKVILGEIELKDKNRWRMALDYLHHAGVLDKQAVIKAQNQQIPQVNLNLDQRRQAILAAGDADLQERLKLFAPPS